MEGKKIIGQLADGTNVYSVEGKKYGVSSELIQDALGRILKPEEVQIVNLDKIVGFNPCIRLNDQNRENVFEVIESANPNKKGKPVIINHPPEACSKIVVGLSTYYDGYTLESAYIGDEVIPEGDYSNDFWNSHAYVYDSTSIQNITQVIKLHDGSVVDKGEFEKQFIFNKEVMQAKREEEEEEPTPSKKVKKTLLFLIGAPVVLKATGASARATVIASEFSGERVSAVDIREEMKASSTADASEKVNEEIIRRTEDIISRGEFALVESEFFEPYGSKTLKNITETAKESGYKVQAIIVKYIRDIMVRVANASPSRADCITELYIKQNEDYERLAEQLKQDGVKVDVVEDVINRKPEAPTGPDLI